jgi:hypothetical protein
MKVTGRTTRCTAKAYSNGPMAEYTKATTSTIKNKAWERSLGLTAASTKACGKTGCSTARANTKARMIYGNRAYGRMENE